MKVWKRILPLLMVTLCVALLCGGCEGPGDGSDGKADVSPLVEQWREDVERYAQIYDVSEYVELILAMIAQESGGDASLHPDIMQCSESAGMPPNSISDPRQSLDQGIKYLASLVKRGKFAGVDDDTILQSYNFGGGYIDYVAANYSGKHSEPAVRAFSSMMAARFGWSSYGDVKYVEHVRSHMVCQSSGGGIPNYGMMKAVMQEYLGVPYVFGGDGKSGIDCSAMSRRLYAAIGVSLPRIAQDQYDAVRHIPEPQVQPGDLVFFTGTYDAGAYITHVGVYAGNNTMFHAGGTHCQYTEVTGYYREHLAGFGRP